MADPAGEPGQGHQRQSGHQAGAQGQAGEGRIEKRSPGPVQVQRDGLVSDVGQKHVIPQSHPFHQGDDHNDEPKPIKPPQEADIVGLGVEEVFGTKKSEKRQQVAFQKNEPRLGQGVMGRQKAVQAHGKQAQPEEKQQQEIQAPVQAADNTAAGQPGRQTDQEYQAHQPFHGQVHGAKYPYRGEIPSEKGRGRHPQGERPGHEARPVAARARPTSGPQVQHQANEQQGACQDAGQRLRDHGRRHVLARLTRQDGLPRQGRGAGESARLPPAFSACGRNNPRTGPEPARDKRRRRPRAPPAGGGWAWTA